MIYPITVYGLPVLRKETVDIDKDYPNLQKLVDDMFLTMYHADGVGLAAPQIDLSIRLFVIDLNILAEEKPEFKGFKKAFINAKIVERSEELESCEEGCLSLPGINEMVKRPKQIRIQYYNEKFEFFDEVYDGYKARVIQHEYDHLEGLMFIDHVSPIRRQMNKGKLSNMAKGKLRCRYNVKTA
ncbi:MAG: peptide deformylase [Paludibacteraceae bacterium]|nr:peptide deformylase [Paludibacteraceae bacterium]